MEDEKKGLVGFQPGNQCWKLRPHHGPDLIFKTPDILMNAAEKYFDWNKENPIIERMPVIFAGRARIEEVPRDRPLSIEALCTHLRITVPTWYSYRKRAGFEIACSFIENIIFHSLFEKAALNIFNQNLIARKLSLADKQNHEVDAKITAVTIDKETYLEARRQMLEEDDC